MCKPLISLFLLLFSLSACQLNDPLPDQAAPKQESQNPQPTETKHAPEMEATAVEPQTPLPLATDSAPVNTLPPLG
ncbi:MAG: hypothetical protein JSV68_03915, partial [Anaerolineaceae bacterium]